jgi:uncharacterized protein YecE (DUF72 family)
LPDDQLQFGWSDDGTESQSPPRAAAMARQLGRLAGRQIYLGTSSWKYPGWLDQVYSPSRYTTRRGFSEKKFKEQCLTEYAEVFPTVCGDFAFYQFPSEQMWQGIFDQLPSDYRFSLKVCEDVTVLKFPNLPRYGQRAGQDNAHFMDADLVKRMLLDRIDRYREQLGVLIFEFGTIHGSEMSRPDVFAEELDKMLSHLPTDEFRFAVEVRNRAFVEKQSAYFNALRENRTAHCFNSWTRMPSVLDQMSNPEAFTAPHAVARFLLRPGRSYQDAVEAFQPYERMQDPYPEGQQALEDLIHQADSNADRSLFAFVNNRFEGSAIESIETILARLQNS